VNAKRLRSLIWLASFATAGTLGWHVYDFLDRRAELEKGVGTDEQLKVLQSVEAPPQPSDDVVDYANVERVYHGMNWTGKVDAKPKVDKPQVEAPKPSLRPVEELLAVLFIQVDTDSPEASLAYVAYLDPKLLQAAKSTEDRTLKPGEHLLAPYEAVVVDSIRPDGVLFRFDGAEREPELVAPLEPEGLVGIVAVAPGGTALVAPRTPLPQSQAQFNTRETMQIGSNAFRIGSETAKQVETDYSRILSQDIRYTKHRDPTTRQVDGLRITSVAPNSIPAAHGFTEGEVIKSINGYKVTSVNGAISYVKSNASTTSLWEVVIMKQGREYTRVFHSPE